MAGLRNSIAGYEILSVIMEGKNSTVYQALDLQTRWEVAVKTVTVGAPKFKLRTRQLKWEYTLRDRLNHPNLIKIHRFGQTRTLAYLVMEFFRGQNLRGLMRSDSPMLSEKAIDIVSQVAAALYHLHQNGIVHRDVKPENILVNSAGDVKVIDFAIAVELNKQWKRWFGRHDGIRGTRTYMSPEQVRGKAVSPQSDVYSLGVLLYELAAGRPPFMDIGPDQLLASHLEDTPVPLNRLVPNVHPGFEELVNLMLAKPAELRPPDMLTVQRRLREVSLYR